MVASDWHGARDGVVRRVTIVIAGRNEAKAGLALASLRELGAQCAFITGDVTKKTACVKLVVGYVWRSSAGWISW